MTRPRVLESPDRCRASRRATLIAAGALCLAACASNTPIRYHSIEPLPAAARSASSGMPLSGYRGDALRVGRIEIPAGMNREPMMRQLAPGQFEVREFDHWAAPLAQLVRRALAEDLVARTGDTRGISPAAIVLDVDIVSFDATDRVATMVLTWSLRSPSQSAPAKTLASKVSPIRLRLQTAVADSAGATALAWSELIAQLADRVLAEIDRRVP